MTLDNTGHALPPGLLIPQSVVEAAMIAALEKFGVSVERQTTLESFVQSESGVVCQISTPQGDESFEAAYLFGCDGAHSTVRHTLQLDFPGESVTHRWLLGDIEVEVQDGINPNKPDSERERTLDPGWIYSTNSDQGSLRCKGFLDHFFFNLVSEWIVRIDWESDIRWLNVFSSYCSNRRYI